MEGKSVDADRFDGLARTVAERGEERARDSDQFEALTRLVAAKGSRRVALAGLLGAVLHGVGLQSTAAQCRSKEGKEKRQCRRRQRQNNAPGGLFACQDKLFGLCFHTDFGGPGCCDKDLVCQFTVTGFVTACQLFCNTDADCRRKFPTSKLVCRRDIFICPSQDVKCCVPG
jgi:hypothetical protein